MPAGIHNAWILDTPNANDSALTPLAKRQGRHQAWQVGHGPLGCGRWKTRRTWAGLFGVDVPDW